MDLYATWCGKALALSHARAGCSATLRGYMGKSDIFDRAIATFSVAYADQNERDHAALDRAVRMGKVKAVIEEGTHTIKSPLTDSRNRLQSVDRWPKLIPTIAHKKSIAG